MKRVQPTLLDQALTCLQKSILSALLIFCSISCFSQDLVFKAWKINVEQNIHFPFDKRLDFGDVGTVEFFFFSDTAFIQETWLSLVDVAIKQKTDFDPKYTVLAQQDSLGTKYAIKFNESLTRIGIDNGSEFKSIPYNFRKEPYYHVGVSFDGDLITIIVNEENIGSINIKAGQSYGHPLQIGDYTDVDNNMVGSLAFVRIWDRPLSLEEMQDDGLKVFWLPKAGLKFIDNLMAYTIFSQYDQSMQYTNVLHNWSKLSGVPGTTAAQYILKKGERFTGVDIAFNKDGGISDLSFDIRHEDGKIKVFNPVNEGVAVRDQSYDLRENDIITGFAGTYDMDGIKALRLLTSDGGSRLFRHNDGEYDYLFKIGDDHQIHGVEIQHTDNRLSGFRIAYTKNTILPVADKGYWMHMADGNPIRNDRLARHHEEFTYSRDGSLLPHGNYTSFPVYHLSYDAHRDEYIIQGDYPVEDLSIESHILKPRIFKNESGDHYRHGELKLLILDENTFRIQGEEYPLFKPGFYQRATQDQSYDTTDKISWGGTFALDQRPPLLEYNFYGYNIAKMHYNNYQLGTGAPRMVFAMPTEGSRDYYFSNNGKIIPNGIIFKNDRESLDRARVHTVTNLSDHTKAWNMNLGASIGVPDLMSFGLNMSHSESVEHMRSSGKTNAISMIHDIKYALVLDKAKISLSEEFKNYVYTLRDDILVREETFIDDVPIDDLDNKYRAFLELFGTHYSNAVTYGGMAYAQMEMSSLDRQTTKEQSTEVSGEASGTVEGIQAGVSGGGGTSSKDIDGDGYEDKISEIKTIGGDLSGGLDGGSWSLPDHSEVPVFLDLRPIYELLSPLFFNDSIIYTQIREGVMEALQAYAEFEDEEGDWLNEKKEFQIVIDTIEVINAGGETTHLLGFIGAEVAPSRPDVIRFLPVDESFDPNIKTLAPMIPIGPGANTDLIDIVQRIVKKDVSIRRNFELSPSQFCHTKINFKGQFGKIPFSQQELKDMMDPIKRAIIIATKAVTMPIDKVVTVVGALLGGSLEEYFSLQGREYQFENTLNLKDFVIPNRTGISEGASKTTEGHSSAPPAQLIDAGSRVNRVFVLRNLLNPNDPITIRIPIKVKNISTKETQSWTIDCSN